MFMLRAIVCPGANAPPPFSILCVRAAAGTSKFLYINEIYRFPALGDWAGTERDGRGDNGNDVLMRRGMSALSAQTLRLIGLQPGAAK